MEHLDSPGVCLFRGRTDDGHVVEFLDATTEADARVFVLSTLVGCPVRCAVCDAGGGYLGRLTQGELFAQVDALCRHAFGGLVPTTPRVVVELTRMGEPAFNPAVVDFLERLPERLHPARAEVLLSTVAPLGAEAFFEAIARLRATRYPEGALRLQVSLYTTDEAERRRVVPVKCWSFERLVTFATQVVTSPQARLTLNVPLTQLPFAPEQLEAVFSPALFTVKLSTLTPTAAAASSGLGAEVDAEALRQALEARGFEVELERSAADVASCGTYLSRGVGSGLPRRTRWRTDPASLVEPRGVARRVRSSSVHGCSVCADIVDVSRSFGVPTRRKFEAGWRRRP